MEGTCVGALFAYQAHCYNLEWELEIKIKPRILNVSLQTLLIIKKLSVLPIKAGVRQRKFPTGLKES